MKLEDRINLAKDPSISLKILISLSKDRSYIVRSFIASHRKTPVDIHLKLSKDENWSVRNSLAENQKLTAEVLIPLSKDEDNNVRSSVARNKNTPVEILTELCEDRCHLVYCYAVRNPNATLNLKCRFANHLSDKEVNRLITDNYEKLSSEDLILLHQKTKKKNNIKLIRSHENFPQNIDVFLSAKERLISYLNKIIPSNEKISEVSNMISVFEDSIRDIV